MNKDTLGDYLIIKQIGQGVLGSVYLAKHRFTKQQYVLKVFPEEMATDRNFIQRFEKDIAILAKLEHPHITKVHNISFFEGYYFLVVDCIVDCFGETTNLTQYLSVNKHTLNENEIYELLTQVASALHHLHQTQLGGEPLVHRGLKLNNILIGTGEKGLHIYLSDFGLSHIIGEGAVLTRLYKVLANLLSLDLAQSTFTKLGEEKFFTGNIDSGKLSRLHASFLQTYHFLAPEQKIYRENPVGPWADSYAFGVLTYFLLMHCFPEGRFPLPCEVYPDYRLNWDALIEGCLHPDLSKRPLSLLQSLNALVNPPASKVESFVKRGGCIAKQNEEGNVKEESCVAVAIEEDNQMLSSKQTHQMLREVSNIVRGEVHPVINPQEIKRPKHDPDPAASLHVDANVARYFPKEEKICNIEPIPTEMVIIKGGEYYRGSNEGGRDERPRHKVKLSSFALDVHPVSNEQFARFLEVMGGEKDANNQDIIGLRESRICRYGGKVRIESGYSKHPVIGVTWYGAIAYAKWIGKRLPTEAEWEIAASCGCELLYPTGKSIERTQANFFSTDTTMVMSYPANKFGLYDMNGNVYEWCQDWYDYISYEVSMQRPDNPQGPLQGVYRVLRGGCWKSLKDDLRCSHRHRNNPGIINRTYGFRCAANVDVQL